ncbi:VOC family protein [Rhodovibrionaceae bacterium A322]
MAPFAIKKLDHVVLLAEDFEGLVAFYRDVLGCQVVRRNDGGTMAQLRAGDALVDIFKRKEGQPAAGRNMDHFALRIEPFHEADIRSHLDAHGIKAGAVADRFGADGNGPSLYLQDPEGNGVELKGPPSQTV